MAPKIYVYGNPQWDSIKARQTKKQVLDVIGIKSRYILITSQAMMHKRCILDVVDIAQKIGCPVVVKPHPRENIKRYVKLQKKGKIILLLDADVDLYSLMKYAEINITSWSNTCVESVMLGTPSLLYFKYLSPDPSVSESIEYFKRYGVIVVGNDRVKLENQILFLCACGKEHNKNVIKNTVNIHRNVSKKIVKLIERMCK